LSDADNGGRNPWLASSGVRSEGATFMLDTPCDLILSIHADIALGALNRGEQVRMARPANEFAPTPSLSHSTQTWREQE
jgi:hypothetical protein